MTNVVPTITGDTFKATVTHVASEYRWVKMYVQRDYEMTEHIETYLEGLEPKLSELPGFMHQSQIPLGTPCFARFTDGKWYRAVASAWPRGDNTQVEVTFIDYGNPEIVSVTDVRLGTDPIFHTSPVAIECFLDDVDLQLVAPQGAEALVDFLKGQLQYVEVGITVRRLEQVQVACVRPIVAVTMPDGASLTDIIMQSPLFAVCTVAAPAIVNAPSFHYHAVHMNTPYQVYVAHVEDMARVFLHLAARDPAPFTDMIQAHCVNPSPLDPSLVKEGTACLARFTEDGLLYRSFVYEYKQGICKVLFVDYGNCELKAPNELLVIPPELLKEEIFTIRCNATSTGLDKDTFVKLTTEQELTCQFSPADPPNLYNVEFVGLTSNRPAALTNGLPPGRPQIQIQRLTLESGCRHAMQVTFIESVQVMYAQLREMVNDIEQMSRQLEMESPSLPLLAPVDVVPGAAVACKYDGIWYRAEVLKVGPQVEVWIADYGDTATVDLSDLRPLDPKYTLQPAYATKLTLDGFTCSPMATELVMENLETLVLDAEASVSIVNVLPDGTHSVQIFVGDPPKSVVKALQIALANVEEVRTTKVHTPSVSPVEKLLVMTVVPPQRFFGQFLKVPEGQLDELQAKLGEQYAASAPDPTFRPQPGDHVACRFSEDGAFYRAEVKKVVEGGFDVAYLDYGNEETVSPQDIRPLAPQFGMPPACGMICELKSGEVSDAMLETEVEVRCCACRDGVNVVDFLNSGLRAGSAPVEAARPVAAAVPPPSKPPVAAPAAVPPPSASMSAFGAPVAAAGLPVLKLEPRTAVAAKGVFVKLVDDFYCQLVQNDQLLNQITDDLARVAASQPCLGPAMRKVGSACCALFSEDSLWYRASIVEQRPGGATVLFVDYGNVESVDDAQIRQLPPTLASIPGQAVWCRLAGAVVPAGCSPDIAAGRLDEFILEQEFTLKVVANGPDNFHDVDIVLSDGTNIRELLVQEGLVQASSPPLAVPQQQQMQPQPQPQQVSGYNYPILDQGVGLPCEVSWVLNPGEVYVQQVALIDALEDLMAQMQAHYSGGGEMVTGGVRPGQPCVAKYAEDGRWYRARVTHAKGGRLGVQYVDYGNCEEVPESSVRQILPKFVALPAQAIRCRIRTVAAPGGGDTWPPIDPNSPLSERLQAVFEGQFRCVPAGYRDGIHLVDLERMGSGPSIVEALVAVGLARDVTAAPRGFAGSEASQGPSPKLRAVLAPGEFSFQAQQYVDVKVTAVVSLSEVWCCLVEGVEPLTEALQKAGEAAPQLRNPVPGEGCVARLPGGNEQGSAGEPLSTPWARAVVRSRPSPSKLELFFVDLGGTRVVHHTEVKQIPQELTTQPGQAFQCVLSASFPVDAKELSSKILYKELVLQVDRQLDAAKVAGSLFDTSGDDEVNVLDSFAPPPAPPPVEEEAPPVAEKEAPPVVETSPPAVEKAPLVQAERAPETNGVAAPPAAPTQPRALHRAQSIHKILPCYPPLSKISGKLAAYVMHTESLSGFYVMLKEQESALEEMATRLEECYVNAPLPIVAPCAKLPCVAFYPKDGAWYRAKVVRDMNVQFIDYGNVDTVPEIREIAPEFLEIPPFCYKCKLDGAKELAGVAGADAAFTELVADAELELQVLTWGMEVTVRLFKDGADITALLKEKLAAPSTEPQAAPTSHTEEQAVPAPVSADAVTEAPTREGCTVTHVDGLDSFYVLPLARQADLEALGDKLQEVLGVGSAAVVDNPDGETLYGALYSADGLWYRARVEGAAAEGGLKVRFVDYGNVESVQSVVTLDSEEFRLEPFCMECQLAGLKGAAGPSALEKFKELVLDAELQVETVAPGIKPAVRLFTADGTELLTQLPLRSGYTVCEVPLHQKVQVQVSHVESPTDFFVQLVEQLDALETLTAQLFELPPGDGATVDMSQPCMVFWSDETPYRATVLETSDSAAALVHFVDYGNCDTVEVSGIRLLPSSLVKVPLFAVHCTLDVPEGKLGEEATEELQRLAESEPASSLLAEFLGERNGRYVVRLLDMGIDVLGKLLKGQDSGGDVSPSDAAQGSASQETPEAAPTSGTGDEGDAAAPTVVEAQDSDVSEAVTSSGVEPGGSDGVETAIAGGSDIPEAKDGELQDEAVEEAEFEARGDKLDEKENSGEPAADADLLEEGTDANLNGQGGVTEELLPSVVEEDTPSEDQAGTTTAGDLAPEEVKEATAFEETRTAAQDSRADGEPAMVPIEEPLPEAPAAAAAPLEEERTTLEVLTTVEDDSSKDDATAKLPIEEPCLAAPPGAAAPLREEPATFEEDSCDEDVAVVIRTEEPVLELPAGAASFEEQESEVKVETAVLESAAPTRHEDESGPTSADGTVPEETADAADLASAGAPSVGGLTSELALEDAVLAGVSAPNSVPEATPLEAPLPEVESQTEVTGDASLVVAEEVPADGSQSKGELDKSPVASESATVGSVPVDEAPACAEVPLELGKEHGDKTEPEAKPEQESDTATTEVESALALEKPDEGSPREACGPTPEDRPVALSEKGEGPSSLQRVGANDSAAAGAVTPVVSSAIGAGGDAAGFKAEATVSPYPSRRRMPDECVVPGVCTNPELFASPSDEGD
ncbi:protein tudor-like isoform X2 [Haemaphysalis longicornis]